MTIPPSPTCWPSPCGWKGSTATPRPTPPGWSSATGRLTQLVPLYRDPRSELPATQFNMKWVESAGLVKFDFLGLKTLTVLDRAQKHLARRGAAVDLDRLAFDDAPTYELMTQGQTVGVFQL